MPANNNPTPSPLRIAIIGGGPAGLGAAIALSSLSFASQTVKVDVTLYEQTRELREVGAGINIGFNCWRVLELLGAEGDVRGFLQGSVLHRNGLTGEILHSHSHSSSPLPLRYRSRRVRRTRLQAALLSRLPGGIIQLNKRLVSLRDIGDDGAELGFGDGTVTRADLVVGGDGIRSVVRESIFPTHRIQFTGTTIWRTLIPISSISHIPDLSSTTEWCHGPTGHCYFSPVDDPSEVPESKQMLEISARYLIDPATDKERRFSWGIPATNERVDGRFREYESRVREVISQVPEGQWKEFSAFAGPRLEKLVAWDKVVLLGDASHPLSGAFGSGAAFALGDGWILARALEYAYNTLQLSRGSADENNKTNSIDTKAIIPEALSIFDEIRSPYYLRMYEYLDNHKQKVQETKAKAVSEDPDPVSVFERTIQARIQAFNVNDQLNWIYGNDIEVCWKRYLQDKENSSEKKQKETEKGNARIEVTEIVSLPTA